MISLLKTEILYKGTRRSKAIVKITCFHHFIGKIEREKWLVQQAPLVHFFIVKLTFLNISRSQRFIENRPGLNLFFI